MSAEPCVKCGKLRKVDIIWTSQGWLQPGCVHCGDPGYLELHEDECCDLAKDFPEILPCGEGICTPNMPDIHHHHGYNDHGELITSRGPAKENNGIRSVD